MNMGVFKRGGGEACICLRYRVKCSVFVRVSGSRMVFERPRIKSDGRKRRRRKESGGNSLFGLKGVQLTRGLPRWWLISDPVWTALKLWQTGWKITFAASGYLNRKEKNSRPPPQLCYSSSGGKAVYCRGQGPRRMFTGSLRRAIVVKSPSTQWALKIISCRAPTALRPSEDYFNQILDFKPQKNI